MVVQSRQSPARLRRLVVIRPGALGDTLLTFPTLVALRRAFPEVALLLVCRGDVHGLVRASGLADATSAYDAAAWAALFAPQPPRSGLAARELHGAAAIAWLADPEGQVTRTLAALGADPALVAPGRPPQEGSEHAALFLARSLASLGIRLPASPAELMTFLPQLTPSAADDAHAAALWRSLALDSTAQPVVALHPGSGGSIKRWPPEHFAALARALPAEGITPLLLGGPQDGPTLERLIGAPPGTPLPLARNLSIGTLASLLLRCAAYVGNDSGVSHLAGLLGIPTLALFGPTDPHVWAPLGIHVKVLRAPGQSLTGLAVEHVLEALRRLLGAKE